ncbi:hypothetical protein Sarmat_00072 [Rickettsiales endosymbiont of Paramecium tredecaurelia]|nr:hypothetical protein [Candidatus Sarmatiella mevalonica]
MHGVKSPVSALTQGLLISYGLLGAHDANKKKDSNKKHLFINLTIRLIKIRVKNTYS